jgi:hypothetical protein
MYKSFTSWLRKNEIDAAHGALDLTLSMLLYYTMAYNINSMSIEAIMREGK